MTPAPAEGARNAAIASSGPVIQRRWCSQSVCETQRAAVFSAPADGALCTAGLSRPQAAPALRTAASDAGPGVPAPVFTALSPADPRLGRDVLRPRRRGNRSPRRWCAVVSGTPSVVHGPSVASWPPRLRRVLHDTHDPGG